MLALNLHIETAAGATGIGRCVISVSGAEAYVLSSLQFYNSNLFFVIPQIDHQIVVDIKNLKFSKTFVLVNLVFVLHASMYVKALHKNLE